MSQTWTQAYLGPCPLPTHPGELVNILPGSFKTSHTYPYPLTNNTPSIPGRSHPHPSVPYTSSRWCCKGQYPALWQQKSASPCLDAPVTISPIGHLIHSLTGPKGGPSLPSFSSQSAKVPWLSHLWEGPGLWTL